MTEADIPGHHILSHPIAAFTDYPMTHLGDASGEHAPVRPVEVIAYDGDKHATVRIDGTIVCLKRFYLYREARTPYGPGASSTAKEIAALSVSRSKLLRSRRQTRTRKGCRTAA